MTVSPPAPDPLPTATSTVAAPPPSSQDIDIKVTPETPLESAPQASTTARPASASASGSNADAKQDAAGSRAASIKEQLAVSTTPTVAGVASPSGVTAVSTETQKTAATGPKKETPAQPRLSTTIPDDVNPVDFEGSVTSNNEIPSAETLRKIENYMVLDKDGRSHSFKSLYSGSHTARRVLVIFVRHFFCGQCQEYLRQLSASITPEALLRLPVSTFITVVGCGDPGLIEMYASETGCPFPIYADPQRKLYDELGMVKTLALGQRPAYVSKSVLKTSIESVFQGLKQVKKGLATKGGDARQIGGEFLFEPLNLQSPISTPWSELEKKGFEEAMAATASGETSNGSGPLRSSETSLDGKFEESEHVGEEKRVTWCHRMKTTRDHAEIPELMEVLGLDGQGMPIKDSKRWERALEQRKGTGLSMASQISAMKARAGGL
ncbi:AhpC/TSA antioxidant enzyme-domain-containing protein [Rhypophila decipiens]|uniref:AhpC/TSA antioxidant enzyme-domain-containing protein n=1 Tax=Rhypophila decipiens TaxID=261697 RepID=A0AAN7BBC0_9PEZI|nr:AhpC/TSA antioxidant enzyme-domain-containing protein [Rhypophila decipiens]